MTITESSQLTRNPDIVSSEIDGETVMMDIDFKRYFGMTEIGTRVWQLLESQITFEHLCVKLTEEFDVSQQRCAEDMLPFLQNLEKNQMLFVSSS